MQKKTADGVQATKAPGKASVRENSLVLHHLNQAKSGSEFEPSLLLLKSSTHLTAGAILPRPQRPWCGKVLVLYPCPCCFAVSLLGVSTLVSFIIWLKNMEDVRVEQQQHAWGFKAILPAPPQHTHLPFSSLFLFCRGGCLLDRDVG